MLVNVAYVTISQDFLAAKMVIKTCLLHGTLTQMVIATKRNGDLRTCVDPRPPNQALKRERYHLPVLDDNILPDLARAKCSARLTYTMDIGTVYLMNSQLY